VVHYDRELDARRLSCPLPFLNTRHSLESLKPGEVIKIVTTDSGSVRFFQSLARQTELQLLLWHELDGEYNFFIMKS
jgi:tRNA 2-thiouridine synthesizing protein A